MVSRASRTTSPHLPRHRAPTPSTVVPERSPNSQPLKRKAASSGDEVPELKRTTRSSDPSAPAPPHPAAKSKKPAAPKQKPAPKEATRQSSDVEIDEPLTKKASAQKKEPAPKKDAILKKEVKGTASKKDANKAASKNAPVDASPATTTKASSKFAAVAVAPSSYPDSLSLTPTNAAYSTGSYDGLPGRASTSTTPVPDTATPIPKPKARPKSPPKKAAPVSWEQGLNDWFAKFADEDEPDKMGGEGIERLFEEMEVSMEGVLPFLLAWKINAKPGTFGSYALADFVGALREGQINTTAGLKSYLLSVEKPLYPAQSTAAARKASEQDFKKFYLFLFPYLRADGQKSVAAEMAIAIWATVLAPRFPIGQEFVDYVQTLGTNFKAVSTDVWTQLLEFVSTVGDDFSGYSDEDSWPAVFDSFAEYRAERRA